MAAQLFEVLGEGAVVKATVIEVMGRRVVDLSSRDRHECQLQQSPGGPVEAYGAEVTDLRTAAQMQTLLRRAMALRTTQRTGVNETSSRSHAIVHLVIEPSGSAPVRTPPRALRVAEERLLVPTSPLSRVASNPADP